MPTTNNDCISICLININYLIYLATKLTVFTFFIVEYLDSAHFTV